MAEVIKTGNSDTVVTDRYGTPVPMSWNWGAFFLNWIWGIHHKVWISLLFWVPIVAWVMPFYLGSFGSRLAWEKGNWESAEQFIRFQRNWAKWGIGIFVAYLIVCIIAWTLLLVY